MKEKPLTQDELKQCQMIIQTKHTNDKELTSMALWSYEQYLLSRWRMKQDGAVCPVDHDHVIHEYGNECRVQTNLRTGEEESLEQFGDSEYECQGCLGRKTQVVLFDYHFEEMEALLEPANQSA